MLTLAIAGCSGDEDAGTTTTTTTRRATTMASTTSTTTTTSSTAPAEPFAVPDPITGSYVQRVLDEHERIANEAILLLIEAGQVTPEVDSRIRSINGQILADTQLRDLTDEAEAGFPTFVDNPEPRTVEVIELLTADETCIGARVEFSFEAVVSEPGPVSASLIELVPAASEHDPESHNQTGWITEIQFIEGQQGDLRAPCTG